MKILLMISQYIKYLYIPVILGIIWALYLLLKTLLNLGNSALKLSNSLEHIAKDAEILSQKANTISKQTKNSIPWLSKNITAYAFIGKLKKDIDKLKNGKLSRLSIAIKAFQYQKTISPLVSKILKRLKPES